MAFRWPLKFELQKPGESTITHDRFGNEKIIPGEPIPVKVFSWEIVRSEEKEGESVLRTIDDLRIIAPPDTFAPEDTVTLPGGGKWTIEGHAEDNRNNPYFDAGLVTYHAQKVEG